jgi:hypothetical protein
MAPLKSVKWMKALEAFIADIRISSKEVSTTDGNGSPLVLWESQKRFLREVGQGLDMGVHKFICLKSRQLGITTVSLAITVFWLAVHPDLIMCLVTDDEKKREANRKLLTKYVESFPDGYFGGSFKIVSNNRTSVTFSNGARLDLLVAGTKKKSIGWAEGVGYGAGHMTEVSNYGDVEGLKSLEEGFAQTNPHRIYMYESTAKGYNHWRTMFLKGQNDLTTKSFFIGWWAGDTNRIERKDPRFNQFGLYPPNPEEKHKIESVRAQYGWKITPEQLAWYRWKRTDAGAEQGLLDQNQPFDENEAFVMSGYSFFQTRVIDSDLKALLEDPPIFKGYRYQVDGDFYSFKMMALNPEIDSVDDVELKVWEEPVDGAKYAIGFDPAYGRNEHKDGSAIVVLRCFADRVVQVAEYRSSEVEARHAAWVAFHICAAYRDCMINVELTGPGRLVMAEFDHLRQLLGAEMNVARTEQRGWQDAAANARWFLHHREDSFGSGFAANYETTWRYKQEMLYKLKGSYVSRELDIRSMALLNEMKNVVVDNDDIGAPESTDEDKKDDRVFALGLANLAWMSWIRKEMISQGLTYDTVMAAERGDTELATHGLNSLVYRFLARADEPIEREPTWRELQGLE